jgi:hypothetical protein
MVQPNCKQRRKARLRAQGRIFGREWYLKNIKNDNKRIKET